MSTGLEVEAQYVTEGNLRSIFTLPGDGMEIINHS